MSFHDLSLFSSTRHDVYPFIDPKQNLKGVVTGKNVLVTGAGTGVGRAIAEQFALAGANNLIIAARRAEPLESTKASIHRLVGDECKVIAHGGIDVSSEEAVKTLFSSLDNVPDILVHNAAVAAVPTPIVDADAEQWFKDIDVNIKGTFLINQAYLRALKNQGRSDGRIVNLSSNASWRIIPGLSSYGCSKVSVNLLSEYVDRECRMDPALAGVRCFALHPGGVAGTDLSKDAPEQMIRMLIDKAELAAGTAVYLGTERADYLGGRFVNATWDMENLESVKEQVEKDDLLKTRVVGMEWRDRSS